MDEALICTATLVNDQDLVFSTAERQILRELAGQVADLASRPIEVQKRQLWRDHNALKPTRPVVFCDPEIGWNEIIPPGSLACSHPTARDWEFQLRREVYWGQEMGDDRVVNPYFEIAHIHADPDWGAVERKIEPRGEDRTAYTWEAPIHDEKDWERVHTPVIRVDFGASERLVNVASDLFGDLLEVRLKTDWWWTLGMTWTLIKMRGMQTFMFDLVDRPNFVHRMMATLRDGTVAMITALEQAGLLYPNWDGTYVGSGGYGWSDELPAPGHTSWVRLRDMWGFAESQETVGISPRMFEEFIFPYQLPILEKFGLNCYGCCEPLDKRWHIVRRIPRLRRVSVSPWSSREFMAQNLADRYILSMKPNPAALAFEWFDEENLRAELRRDLELTRDCRVEVIMKDVTTMCHDPHRAKRWVELAMQTANDL